MDQYFSAYILTTAKKVTRTKSSEPFDVPIKVIQNQCFGDVSVAVVVTTAAEAPDRFEAAEGSSKKLCALDYDSVKKVP